MNDQARPTTILIVDDHALVRDGLCGLLNTQKDMQVVGEAGDSEAAVAEAARARPDIVLLEGGLPGGEVTTTINRIHARSPASRIIILSMYEGPQLVQAAIRAGIRGYLLKTIRGEQLVSAIRAVRADHYRMVLEVSRESLVEVTRPPHGLLSGRELQVLELTAQALSNSQIASRLSLTEATVKKHLQNIFVKLGAVSRIDAVNKAKAASLVTMGRLDPHTWARNDRSDHDPAT